MHLIITTNAISKSVGGGRCSGNILALARLSNTHSGTCRWVLQRVCFPCPLLHLSSRVSCRALLQNESDILGAATPTSRSMCTALGINILTSRSRAVPRNVFTRDFNFPGTYILLPTGAIGMHNRLQSFAVLASLPYCTRYLHLDMLLASLCKTQRLRGARVVSKDGMMWWK
jgi:hypothetical protein